MPVSRHREVAGIGQKMAEVKDRLMVQASHLAEVLVNFPRIEDWDKRNHRPNTAWMPTEMEMPLTIMPPLTHLIISGRSRRIGTI
jgi:hypothetical protein